MIRRDVGPRRRPNVRREMNDQPAPATAAPRASRSVLEPHERIAEVLFGLIMVLTFTGSLSIAEAGRDDIRVMLIGALGCNFAWGIIDAILYLMGCLAEKGQGIAMLRALRDTRDSATARMRLQDALPEPVAAVIAPAELAALHERLLRQPPPPARARLGRDDWLGALGVFLWVFLSTFPVAVPFIFMQHAPTALRVSNAVAIVMLFIAGAAYGRCVGRPPWLVGLAMVALGALLVALTIALGG